MRRPNHHPVHGRNANPANRRATAGEDDRVNVIFFNDRKLKIPIVRSL